MSNILNLTHIEAKHFFLKEESYFNFDLPKYFTFENLLQNISTRIQGRSLSDFHGTYTAENTRIRPTNPCDSEGVNYIFLNNKDGKYSWRPFQLIHPALYVSLVHKVTEEENWSFIVSRFHEFAENAKIECCSIPIQSESDLSDKAVAVTNWWSSIEQKSIELALDFEYVLHTDISDCYGSIYTHSVAWALHTKPVAKEERRNRNLIGNVIDKHLQDMSHGQTNGIPQGSVLMDLIAEMILGYADIELSQKISEVQIEEYKIIRYRDDYRVFTNNPQEGEIILKFITEILIELGMRLNTQKTLASNNVIIASIKPDKLYWKGTKNWDKNLQQHLLLIHKLSNKFPNSGSLTKALTQYYNRIQKINSTYQNINVLISILVDIVYKNPRTYPISSAILSELLLFIPTKEEQNEIINKIIAKFNKIPNTGHLQIWLQRVILKIDREKEFKERLCLKVNDQSLSIWNSDWLNETLKNIILNTSIIDTEIIENTSTQIESEEVQLFETRSNYPW